MNEGEKNTKRQRKEDITYPCFVQRQSPSNWVFKFWLEQDFPILRKLSEHTFTQVPIDLATPSFVKKQLRNFQRQMVDSQKDSISFRIVGTLIDQSSKHVYKFSIDRGGLESESSDQ